MLIIPVKLRPAVIAWIFETGLVAKYARVAPKIEVMTESRKSKRNALMLPSDLTLSLNALKIENGAMLRCIHPV